MKGDYAFIRDKTYDKTTKKLLYFDRGTFDSRRGCNPLIFCGSRIFRLTPTFIK